VVKTAYQSYSRQFYAMQWRMGQPKGYLPSEHRTDEYRYVLL